METLYMPGFLHFDEDEGFGERVKKGLAAGQRVQVKCPQGGASQPLHGLVITQVPRLNIRSTFKSLFFFRSPDEFCIMVSHNKLSGMK